MYEFGNKNVFLKVNTVEFLVDFFFQYLKNTGTFIFS